MLIYLVRSKKSKWHIATRIYIYSQTVDDGFDITAYGLSKMMDRYEVKNMRFAHKSPICDNTYTIRFDWLQFTYINNIQSVKEVSISSMADLIDVIKTNGIAEMDKVRLMEYVDYKGLS